MNQSKYPVLEDFRLGKGTGMETVSPGYEVCSLAVSCKSGILQYSQCFLFLYNIPNQSGQYIS